MQAENPTQSPARAPVWVCSRRTQRVSHSDATQLRTPSMWSGDDMGLWHCTPPTHRHGSHCEEHERISSWIRADSLNGPSSAGRPNWAWLYCLQALVPVLLTAAFGGKDIGATVSEVGSPLSCLTVTDILDVEEDLCAHVWTVEYNHFGGIMSVLSDIYAINGMNWNTSCRRSPGNL